MPTPTSASAATTTLAAARGTLLSIALRLASFLLSQLTVRFVSASALGKASIPLELLLSTALFVSREGFRLALTKEVGEDDDGDDNDDDKDGDVRANDRRIANVAWLTVPAGALASAFALRTHLRGCAAVGSSSSVDYKVAGVLYCLAAFVESLSEPLVVRCLRRMDVATKAKAEGVALVAKSVGCFGCLRLFSSGWFKTFTKNWGWDAGEGGDASDFAVTAFGISQLVYASTFTAIMYRKGRSSPGGIQWPTRVEPSTKNPYREGGDLRAKIKGTMARHFDLRAVRLALAFALQGLFKHALTEADKIVLSALAGSYDQGVYALAASYGGLAARLLLQPIEENARLCFSRLGASVARRRSASSSVENGGGEGAVGGPELADLESTYFFLLRGVLYVGFVFAAVAVNYTAVLLRMLAGSRWGSNDEASAALSAFCVYTAFLALNGTTEAFVYGVARSGNDVGKLGIAHAVIGGIFALIAPGLVKSHGAVGLVAANCISMGLRSMYSLYYARVYFAKAGRRIGLMGMLPHTVAVVLFCASFFVTRLSKTLYTERIADGKSWIVAGAQHISIGVLCVVATMATSLWLEKDVRVALMNVIKRKRE